MNKINPPYRLLKLDRISTALVPPLEAIEEGYNLIHCHKCGCTENPEQFDDALGYRLMEHDECFNCYFDGNAEEIGYRSGVSEAEREAA